MSNLDNSSKINTLEQGPPDLPPADEEPRPDEETLADYLARAGKSSVQDVAVARVKKPKRPKPASIFPALPSLF